MSNYTPFYNPNWYLGFILKEEEEATKCNEEIEYESKEGTK